MKLVKVKASWQAVKAFFRHLGKGNKGNTTAGNKAAVPPRPQEPVAPFPYQQEEVAFTSANGSVTLAGTLTLPSSGTAFAAVVLVHGSGAHTRDEVILGHKPFLLLADYLTRRGVAVLRYDKRGVGKSTGNIQVATTLDFADDAGAAVEFLKGRSEIDRARIGIIGHSEGGMIAPVVASRTADLGFVILLAGPGVTGERILLTQIEALSNASGKMSDLEVKKAVSMAGAIYEILKSDPDNESAAAQIKTTRFLFGLPGKALDEGIPILTSPWFRTFLTFDPALYLAQTHCPVLALNGDKDLQVLPAENLAAIKNALSQAGNTQVTTVTVAGVNHLFQTCQTGVPAEYGAIEETIAPAVLERIAQWLAVLPEKGTPIMDNTVTVAGESGVTPPAASGEIITFGKPTPNRPIIPFIEGDGIGLEIGPAARKILDAAVNQAYGGERQIAWMEIFAGDKARDKFGEPLPDETLAAIRHYGIAIKGPLSTPSGGGMRSLNVAMRKELDLFRCVRPVRYYDGVPSRVVAPKELDIVIFRENTEDLYAGIEFEQGTAEAVTLIKSLAAMGVEVPEDSGIGVKVISEHGSKRLVRSAIQFALANGRKVVTLVAKGNIMKYTEGAFRKWGYEVAKDEFAEQVVTEDELWSKFEGKLPEGKILINDRITDAMFAELLLRPGRYSVIATMNLNGDYLSDAAAAQVGGLGIAPGANIGDNCAIFEATHGTAPDIAGKNIANPTSLLLSGVMMLQHLGWNEAAALVVKAVEKTLADKTVTGDLARLMPDSKSLSTSAFADAVVANISGIGKES